MSRGGRGSRGQLSGTGLAALAEVAGVRPVGAAHPFLTGRPGRVAALERLITRMHAPDGLWIASLGGIAAHAESLDLPARTLAPPELPPP